MGRHHSRPRHSTWDPTDMSVDVESDDSVVFVETVEHKPTPTLEQRHNALTAREKELDDMIKRERVIIFLLLSVCQY